MATLPGHVMVKEDGLILGMKQFKDVQIEVNLDFLVDGNSW